MIHEQKQMTLYIKFIAAIVHVLWQALVVCMQNMLPTGS